MALPKHAARYMTSILLTLLLTVILHFPAGAQTTLEYEFDGNPVQSAWTSSSAAVSWHLKKSSDYITYPEVAGIRVYAGTDSSHLALAAELPPSAESYTLTGLKPASEYCIRLIPYASDGKEGYEATVSDVRTAPDGIQNLRQTRWYYRARTLDVEWDRIPYAERYEVTLFSHSGKIVQTMSLKGSYAHNASFTGMKDRVYTVSVCACYRDLDGKELVTPAARIICCPQARLKNITQKKGSLKITWGKVAGASGYDIYISTKPGTGYRKVKSVSSKKTSLTIKKFKGKKISKSRKYYVIVETKKGSAVSGRHYYWCSRNFKTGSFKSLD